MQPICENRMILREKNLVRLCQKQNHFVFHAHSRKKCSRLVFFASICMKLKMILFLAQTYKIVSARFHPSFTYGYSRSQNRYIYDHEANKLTKDFIAIPFFKQLLRLTSSEFSADSETSSFEQFSLSKSELCNSFCTLGFDRERSLIF